MIFGRPWIRKLQGDEMARRILKIGICAKDDFRKRTIAIAKGEYKPKKNEPTIWFESMESLGQVLSGQNQRLLRLIKESSPLSLTELEKISGRKKSNLSRTLKTLSNYGFVDLVREKGAVRPVVKATEFRVELSI
jgi:predicted transcriptional regulator